MKIKLLFDENASETNNNFHPGLNVTVRRGTKYLISLVPGYEIELENLQGEYLGEGTVHQVLGSQIKDIPDEILALEHDPKCRKLEGLIEVLQNCYNDPEIDGDEVVTAIVMDLVTPIENIEISK